MRKFTALELSMESNNDPRCLLWIDDPIDSNSLCEGDHKKAESFESRLPGHYWTEDCYAIDQLSRIRHHDAAANLNNGHLRHLFRAEDQGKWTMIKRNVHNGGLCGWGYRFNLIHALREEGRRSSFATLAQPRRYVELQVDAEDHQGRTAFISRRWASPYRR